MPKPKRATRTPGVYPLPGGGFRYYVRDATGKQHWHSLDASGQRFTSKQDAYAARLAHLARIANPSPEWSRDSLGAFLETWYAGKPNLTGNARGTYGAILKRRILPHLGEIPLVDLTPAHIRAWHATLAPDYAPSSISGAHMLLSSALNDAVDWDLIPRNVARRVTPPRAASSAPAVWMPDEVRAFLAASDQHPHAAAFRLLLSTGLRIGELLALRWRDVDYPGRQVTIARTLTKTERGAFIVGTTTKTPAGRRTVPLTDSALALLRSHQDRQAFTRRIAGPSWQDDDLVFCSRRGTRYDPGTIRKAFRRITSSVRLPDDRRLTPLRVHGLRHTAATLMLSGGTPVHIVGRILGHSNATTLLSTYAHALPSYTRDAIDELERLLTAL